MNGLPKIGFAGLTHLGTCSALAAASKGFSTIGFDRDPAIVDCLQQNNLPVVEPGLDQLLVEHSSRISFTSEPSKLFECDLVYVAPDVPTDDSGNSSLAALDQLLEHVFEHTCPATVIVVLSQVPPGFTRARQRPNRVLYCQVETLVFGRAVERACRPERIIIGRPNIDAPMPTALDTYLRSFACPILPMRLESAELAKISINCCLAASVTVANMLAELCERVGADWSEIVPALKLDKRIGESAYLSPGLGLAGGNLERDLATVSKLSQEFGTDADAVRAFIRNSEYRKDWVLRTLHEALLSRHSDVRLAVLGLTYKENTHSLKNSPSIALIRHLTPWPLRVYDPIAPATAAPHPNVVGAQSPMDAIKGVHAVAIMTPWAEFRRLIPANLAAAMNGRLVLDPYGVLDRKAAHAAGLDHRVLGLC